MKKIFLFLLVSVFFTSVMAQNYAEVKTQQLPKKVTTYFKKNFKSYTLVRAAKAIDIGGLKYAVVVEINGSNKSVYIFDKDGNFITRGTSLKAIEKASKANTKATPAGK
jgi:hypothetical protein